MALLVLVLNLSGCGQDLLPPLARPDADVRMELDQNEVQQGEPLQVRLQLLQADGVELHVGEPAAEGLEASLEDERVERFDGWSVTTRSYLLRGEPGSYVVALQQATAHHPDGREEVLEPAPLFADIGVQGPTSELEGLLLSEPPEPPAWPLPLALGALLAGLLALAVRTWRRGRRKALAQRPLEPPDVLAFRAWAAVLDDPELDDHGRALGLSEVFRTYLEAIHAWPATALTTREITDALYREGLVSAPLLDRARRLLTATDLLKFARQGGGDRFFQDLDQDFRAYVMATRPVSTVPAVSSAGAGHA